MRMLVGFLFVATCLASTLAETDAIDALDADFEKLARLVALTERHLTSCTLCRVGGDVVADSAAVTHVLTSLHAHCDSTAEALHKFCHAVVDRFFAVSLDYAKTITGKDKCAAYCGINEQPLGNDYFCQFFKDHDAKITFGLNALESRVREVCAIEENQKECMAGFERFKPLITNFLKRTVLRIAREFDQTGFCGIDVATIPNSVDVLKIPRFSGAVSASCTLCNYLVDSACAMLTGNSGNVANHQRQYGCFIYKMCLKIVKQQNQCFDPSGNVADCCDLNPLDTQCNDVAYLILSEGLPLVNQFVWPMACHLMNKECPVSNQPMCIVNSN